MLTHTKTLIIPDITKTESNNCLIIHCFKENNDKRAVEELNRRDIFQVRGMYNALTARAIDNLLEIVHWARNLQISE